MSNNKNAYGSRKRPLSETINNLKSWYRKVRYLIVDAPSYCKDLFSLKCNQLTMRDCAIKNFAIQYIDLNSRNAEKIYKEALARGDTERGIRLLDSNVNQAAPYIEVIGKRTDGNTSQGSSSSSSDTFADKVKTGNTDQEIVQKFSNVILKIINLFLVVHQRNHHIWIWKHLVLQLLHSHRQIY